MLLEAGGSIDVIAQIGSRRVSVLNSPGRALPLSPQDARSLAEALTFALEWHEGKGPHWNALVTRAFARRVEHGA